MKIDKEISSAFASINVYDYQTYCSYSHCFCLKLYQHLNSYRIYCYGSLIGNLFDSYKTFVWSKSSREIRNFQQHLLANHKLFLDSFYRFCNWSYNKISNRRNLLLAVNYNYIYKYINNNTSVIEISIYLYWSKV